MTQTAPAVASVDASTADELLAVENLSCTLASPRGALRIVDGVSFKLRRGETLGIAGESGSGKSMLTRSLMRIAPRAAELTGSVRFDGIDLLRLPLSRMGGYLGPQMAMVFQDPMTALNPVVPIGRQITEGPRRHMGLSRTEAKARALELLDLVRIPESRKRMRQYPHELSGGMRQRVMIAIALACDPQLLIADEATTALDVTVQKQILDLLQDIQAERRMAVIMVSHDLGVLAGRTDRTIVMYGGRVMESASTRELFTKNRHQYTNALLDAIPQMDQPRHTLLRAIPGVPPDPAAVLAGCRFAPRCNAAIERCHTEIPRLEPTASGSDHHYACYVPVNRDERGIA